jgi:drug/metabolite transporter (DMT)-like permease
MNKHVNPTSGSERVGVVLVFLSAFFWSLGGMFARFLETPDSWTQVFWRSLWAAAFLIGFMLWRDGFAGTRRLFAGMGKPGLAVAALFAFCSGAFVIALAYTTVANVVLMAAAVPLFAALINWLVLGEAISRGTWLAIAAVLFGVGVMVSGSFEGTVSPIGDGLALMIAIGFATATVITRRYSNVRMAPATCLGVVVAGLVAATQASTLAVSRPDMLWLVAFGAINLGLGFALFTSGARLIPAAFAALLGTFEPILAPVWVWLVHGEIPSGRTLIGGGIVLAALVAYLAAEFRRRAMTTPAVIGP